MLKMNSEDDTDEKIPTIDREQVSAEGNTKIAKIAKSQKMTKFEIQDRRKKIQKLRFKGISISNIAKLLQVSVGTVEKDLKALAQENREKLAGFTSDDFLAHEELFYDELMELGAAELMATKSNTPLKFRALEFIRSVRNDRRQAYKDCGFISEVTELNVNKQITHSIPWDADTKKKIAIALVNMEIENAALEEPKPDENIIDVEATSVVDSNLAESEDFDKQ